MRKAENIIYFNKYNNLNRIFKYRKGLLYMSNYKYFPEIEEQNKYCNVKLWHDMGITGKGINVWNTESASDHGITTTRRIYDSAPDCKVYQASLTAMSKDGKYIATCDYEGIEYDVEEFIKKYNIKAVNRSVGGGTATDTVESLFWKDLQSKYNLLICNSSGNDGSDGCGGSIPPDVALYIGAVGLVKGKPRRDNYSSIGEELDFVDFRGIWSGTSFASPYYLGVGVLFKSIFGENMTQQEIFKLSKMICMDLDTEGYDARTGWGLPILPDLNIKKYITMTTKTNEYFINGEKHTMDTKPVNKEGTVFVPVRAIAEAIGCDVKAEFNTDKTIKVLISKDDLIIELNTTYDFALFRRKSDGVIIKRDYLNFAPYIDENNRTLVPVRFIAEAFDCSVDWVQKDAKVMILQR